jgi:hypothetical protein
MCRPYLEPWMFTKNVYRYLIETLLKREFNDWKLEKRVLGLHLLGAYQDITNEDWGIIEEMIDDFKKDKVSERDRESSAVAISVFVKRRLYRRGIDLSTKEDDELKGEPYFSKGVMLNTIEKNPFHDISQDGILESLRENDFPQGGKVIRSSFDLINRNALYKGYKYGDLIAICLPPKVGKTTFMLQEAAAILADGFKVAHSFFGDMSEFDGACKLMSCYTNSLIDNVVNNYEEFKDRCKHLLKNWRVAAFPALQMDCFKVVSNLKALKDVFDFDVFMIDYDANLQPTAEMYESGGIMYSTFKAFAQENKCVGFIGVQPKIQLWTEEIIGAEAPAESSRKQHVIDFLITGGRNRECKDIGTFNLPLVRRGVSNVQRRVKFEPLYSRIKEVSISEYDNLLRTHKQNTNGVYI